MSKPLWCAALALLACGFAWAADAPATSEKSPEDFRFEITGADWLLNTGGTIRASGNPIDLVTDLGVSQRQQTFYGKFVFKPGRKHRIVLEGNPIQISGLNTVQRIVTYHGYSFQVDQTLQSSANLTYFFGGYQYDVVTGPMGHLGFSIGAAYLGAGGSIRAVQINTTESTTQTLGAPLVGTEFRVFPIPHHKIVELDADIKGMAAGSYGYMIEGTAEGGICLGPVTLLAGYREMNVDFHSTSASHNGLNARFTGPMFSLLGRF